MDRTHTAPVEITARRGKDGVASSAGYCLRFVADLGCGLVGSPAFNTQCFNDSLVQQ
jgi:hypothetical protein